MIDHALELGWNLADDDVASGATKAVRWTDEQILAAAAEARDMAAWDAGRKRWAMVDGISALLWVVTLALMFIKRGA